MEESINFDVERVKGAENMILCGEELFFTELTGSGKSLDVNYANQ